MLRFAHKLIPIVVNSTRSIIAGHCGEVVWLSVHGAGSKENSADVVKFIEPEIEEGKSRFVVDLDECTGLDSTFMGMLIGVSKRLARVQQGCLHIINAHGRNAQLLRGLGVQYFCSVSEDAGPFAKRPVDPCTCAANDATPITKEDIVDHHEVAHHELTKGEQTQHCFTAHKDLCDASSANKEKFKDVLDLMGQKLMQLQQ